MTFEPWIAEVDDLLYQRWEVTSGDITDRLWRDAFDNGVSPAEMAIEIAEEFKNRELW